MALSASQDASNYFSLYSEVGKHLVFDGQLLHGTVPEETSPGKQRRPGQEGWSQVLDLIDRSILAGIVLRVHRRGFPKPPQGTVRNPKEP